MTQKQIFYSTDFEARLKKDSRGWMQPFELLFFSVKRSRSFIASFDGEKYTNCRLNGDGSLTVYFDHHNMGIGTLRMQRKYATTSDKYSDGSFDLVTPPEQPVFTDEKGDYIVIIDTVNAVTYDEEPQPEPEPEPETPAEISHIVKSVIPATASETEVNFSSTKEGDTITLKETPVETWLEVSPIDALNFKVVCQQTTDLKGRQATLTFVNSQNIEHTVTIAQQAAVIATYGEWVPTFENTNQECDWGIHSYDLKASAYRIDTYNNGQTNRVNGTPAWSTTAGATISGGKVSTQQYTRNAANTRTITVTCKFASVGGNTEKSQSFTITQTVKSEIVLSSSASGSLSAAAATKEVTISTFGTVGTLQAPTSSASSVATATISNSKLTVSVSANETTSPRSATITVTDGTLTATYAVSQQKAELYLYYGHSAGIPESIDTTNSVKLVSGASAKIETANTDKHKCHWVAAKSTATFSIKTWLDKLDTDLNGLGKIKTATVGNYKVYYLLSAGYIANSSRITINA